MQFVADHSKTNKQPLSDKAIRDWQRRFLETGSVHDRRRSGRPGVSSTEHGKNSNIVWTFSMLAKKPISKVY
jgi:hypothetical protein